MISYNYTPTDGVSGVASGKAFAVGRDHPNFKKILEAIRSNNEEEFNEMIKIPNAIEDRAFGQITVKNDKIYYQGVEVHNTLTQRLLELMKLNYPFESHLAFMHNLMQNPSKRAVDELYPWLVKRDCPITQDGHFLGYKYLNMVDDHLDGEPHAQQIYASVHTSTVTGLPERQWKGKLVEMPRNMADDNWGVECSQGFHVGSSIYRFAGDQQIIVKVNPRDVVAVSSGGEKLRTCKYEFLDLFGAIYTRPVATNDGNEIEPPEPEEIDVIEDEDEDDGSPVVMTVYLRQLNRATDQQWVILNALLPLHAAGRKEFHNPQRIVYTFNHSGEAVSEFADAMRQLRFVKSVEF